MKKNIYKFYIALWLLTQTTYAQLLYSETFDNYSVGNISNNNNGTLPGKGNWYTYYEGTFTNDAEIIPELGKGNVLKFPNYSSNLGGCVVFRNDLLSYWQQRQTGNDILKVSFDLYTGDAGNFMGGAHSNSVSVDIVNKDNVHIIGYTFIASNNLHCIRPCHAASRNNPTYPYTVFRNTYHYLITKDLKLPINQWITLEFYVDYLNNKLYFGIPSMGYMIVRDSRLQLGLGNEGYDDSPNKIILSNGGGNFTKDYFPKFDNINISATNTKPTVGLNDFISKNFNLYPNPVTDYITINNSESIGIEKIIVTDIHGKKVKNFYFNNENEVQLNLKDLTGGTYLLQIESKQGIGIKKIIKK